MAATPRFVDIHCHLLPGVDDGAVDASESLAMAEMAVTDGISTIVATPHQGGVYHSNLGDDIRRQTADLQRKVAAAGIPITVLPGADVRVEEGLAERIARGEVLTLGDHRRHVLLELPHELYLPLAGTLDSLRREGVTGILSHPERNGGIIRDPKVLFPLVEAGCLMQVTAGSLLGAFGKPCQQLAEWMLSEGLVHFVASDAHGVRSRRPLLSRAYQRVCELADEATARDLCCQHPALVAAGEAVPAGRRRVANRGGWWRRLTWSQAG